MIRNRPWWVMFLVTITHYVLVDTGIRIQPLRDVLSGSAGDDGFLSQWGIPTNDGYGTFATWMPEFMRSGSFWLLASSSWFQPDGTNVAAVTYGLLQMTNKLCNVVGIIAARLAGGAFSKKVVVSVSLITNTIFIIALYWVPNDNIWGVYIVEWLGQLSYAPTVPLLWVLFADVCDYTEWKTGRSMAGFIYSTFFFALKAGISLGAFLGLQVMAYFGYQANVVQTDQSKHGIVLTLTLIPGIFSVACALEHAAVSDHEEDEQSDCGGSGEATRGCGSGFVTYGRLARQVGRQCRQVERAVREGTERAPASGGRMAEVSIEQAMGMARQLAREGRRGEAEGICRQIVAVRADYVPAWELLGMMAARRGGTGRPWKPTERVTALQPAYAPGRARRWEACCPYWAPRGGGGAISGGPATQSGDDGRALSPGQCVAGGGTEAEAEPSLRTAARLLPGHAETRNSLGIILKKRGAGEEALACFAEAVRLKPDYAEAYANLGATLAAAGRRQEALEWQRRAVGLQGGNAEMHLRLGGTLAACGGMRRRSEPTSGRWRSSRTTWRRIIDYGISLRMVGKIDEAAEAFRRVTVLRGGDGQAWSNLGVMLDLKGERAEALTCYRHAVEADPKNAAIHSNMLYALHFHSGIGAQGTVGGPSGMGSASCVAAAGGGGVAREQPTAGTAAEGGVCFAGFSGSSGGAVHAAVDWGARGGGGGGVLLCGWAGV